MSCPSASNSSQCCRLTSGCASMIVVPRPLPIVDGSRSLISSVFTSPPTTTSFAFKAIACSGPPGPCVKSGPEPRQTILRKELLPNVVQRQLLCHRGNGGDYE